MKKRIKQLTLLFCTLVLLGNISFAAADTASDTDTLLNWAENNYPTYFPTHQTTQSIAPWLFRFYPDTNVYAGVNTNDNGVYVFGGPWGNHNPTYIDSLSNLLLVANNGKLTDVISIVSTGGGYRNFALKADTTLWGWGYNIDGAVGDGTNTNRPMPVKVVGLTGVIQVVGERASIALKNDGSVWAWGWNADGDLGNGTAGLKEFQNTPIQIDRLTNVASIGRNDTTSSSGFYAIKQDGTLWAWGCFANKISRFAVCPDIESPYLPTQISEFSDVIDFKMGGGSYYILRREGTIWAWGDNTFGQLGDGTTNDRDFPIQMIELTGVKDITVATTSGVFAYALKEDGTVWAWGYNSTLGTKEPPSTLTLPTPTLVIGLSDITKISIEGWSRLALKKDGTVWAWAANIGNGSTEGQPNAVQVIGLTDVIDIKSISSGFSSASYALKKDGTVWAWGSGSLKDGAPVEYLIPTQMCTLSGITNIVQSQSATPYLLRNDGTVWNGYFDECTQL